MNDEAILEDSIFKIGKVISVEGRIVKVKVDRMKNSSHLLFKGEVLKNISVGGYIKIVKGFTIIVGKVEGESIVEEKYFNKKAYANENEKINRVLNISLLGFFKEDTFERGIKELPLIDNECFLLQKQEFNSVHDFLKGEDKPITIGTLALEKGQEINIGIDSLLASHVGIFGNTGSGKSYTLAKIYYEVFKQYKDSENFQKNAKFFLIDFNGEYVGSDSNNVIVDDEYKNTYRLSTRSTDGIDKYPVTLEALYDSTFWTVVLEATEKTQAPFLRRSINSTFIDEKLDRSDDTAELIASYIYTAIMKEDKNLEKGVITNFLTELSNTYNDIGSNNLGTLLDDYNRNLQWHSVQGKYYYQDGTRRIFCDETDFEAVAITSKTASISLPVADITDIDKIRLKIIFQYYHEIISGFSNKEHLAPLIKRLDKRVDDLKKVITVSDDVPIDKNFTIVSLREVNLEIRKILPLLICKKLYEKKKDDNDENSYLNIIVDEAHNILSVNSERESEQWKDYRLETFEEIIKEGRKFGVFLTIASQRPFDISPTIISQLHNYFLHRLINNNDIRAIEKTVSYLDNLSFESLPILPTGTCILAGLLAQVPVVVDVGSIPRKYEPYNKTMSLVDKW
jgi:hypothetical protein